MNSWPRTVLRLIFGNLPLMTREQIRRVCSTWNDEVQRMPATLMVENLVANRRCIQVVPIRVDTHFDDEPTTSRYVMPDAISFFAFSRNIATVRRSISLDLRFCKQRRQFYRTLNDRCQRRKWTVKQLLITDNDVSRELFKLLGSLAPTLKDLKMDIKIPLKWTRRRAKIPALRRMIFPALNKMRHLEVLTLPAEFLMSNFSGEMELPLVRELTLTYARAKDTAIPPVMKRMRLSMLRCLNMCVQERVRNLDEKQSVLHDITNAVNRTLAENASMQPCYLTVYLKASKEVQEQSDPWFEVVVRVERPDVIILLCEEIDKL